MRRTSSAVLLAALLLLSHVTPGLSVASTPTAALAGIPPKPADVPAAWKPLIGEYDAAGVVLNVLERSGKLFISTGPDSFTQLCQVGDGAFVAGGDAGTVAASCDEARRRRRRRYDGERIQFGANGEKLTFRGKTYLKRDFGDVQHSFHIAPLRPPDELRKEALAARPPIETKPLRKPDLVELTRLDPAIHLDIRYATSNNFMGTPFYTEARAFLQRSAAEALVRVNRKLRPYGYGLLIHDGYRPWHVTKMFWDATPNDKKDFVADPAKGSNHNRGGAVDLSLYDLRTGKEVEMTGGYDEMSDRSFPAYPGGTSIERWRRDLLRAAMESEGFTVYKLEWWHFDYKDWASYPILNLRFEQIAPAP